MHHGQRLDDLDEYQFPDLDEMELGESGPDVQRLIVPHIEKEKITPTLVSFAETNCSMAAVLPKCYPMPRCF